MTVHGRRPINPLARLLTGEEIRDVGMLRGTGSSSIDSLTIRGRDKVVVPHWMKKTDTEENVYP